MKLIDFLKLVESETGAHFSLVGASQEGSTHYEIKLFPSMPNEGCAQAIDICVATHRPNSNVTSIKINSENFNLRPKIEKIITSNHLRIHLPELVATRPGYQVYGAFTDFAVKLEGMTGPYQNGRQQVIVSPFFQFAENSSAPSEKDLMTLWHPGDPAVQKKDLDQSLRVITGYKITNMICLLRAIVDTGGNCKYAENVALRTKSESEPAVFFAENEKGESQMKRRESELTQFVIDVFDPWGQRASRIFDTWDQPIKGSGPDGDIYRKSDFNLWSISRMFFTKDRPQSKTLEIANEWSQRRKRLMQRAYIAAFLIAHRAPKDLLALI